MIKAKPNNGNETKSDTFPWDYIQILHNIFFIKNIKVFQSLSKSKCLSFMTKLNPKNGNETKLYIFSSTQFLFLSKNIKVFQ